MYGYLLFGVFTVAAANVIGHGKCPEPQAVENFDVASFAGLWYEIAKYSTDNEGDGQCSTAKYTLVGDVIKVKNTNVLYGVQTSVEGTARLQPCANNSGRLILTLKIGDVYREADLIVLTTDYCNYAILYSCNYNARKNTHQVFSWILSRSSILLGAAKTCVDDYIENSSELDSCKFVQTDFSKKACRYTKTVNLSD